VKVSEVERLVGCAAPAASSPRRARHVECE